MSLIQSMPSLNAKNLSNALVLGALTGMRSFAGIRVTMTKSESLIHWAARGEAVADKLPGMPPRTGLLPLAGRAFFGGLAASQLGVSSGHIGSKRGERFVLALVGAVSAIGMSYLACWLRGLASDRGRIAGTAAGLAEDLIVRRGSQALQQRLAA